MLILHASGFIGCWAFGVYAERQENVDAEERSRTVENNREKLSCFGVQNLRPNVASLSACYESSCVFCLANFTWIYLNYLKYNDKCV